MKRKQEILNNAYNKGYAIPQFNIINLEWTKYILEECQSQYSPVFLGVSTSAVKYMGGYKVVNNLIRTLIQELSITIPVFLHLDHAKTIEECQQAYDAGFDSLMIDASSMSIEDNISITNQIRAFAYDTLLEAEIGQIHGSENYKEANYTSKAEAVYFNERIQIDMLAPALGSVHGIYQGEPNIDFILMQEINSAINKPLVLHGCSGLSDEILQKAIKNGVSKMNFDTQLKIAWNESVREFMKSNENAYDPRKIISSGENALKSVVRHYIECLGSKNKG